jgi:predicted RNase H-like HicB family nuclease
MNKTQQFTAIIEREGNEYVSFCPELDIASQGKTVEEAQQNLIEALELFFETTDASEVQSSYTKLLRNKNRYFAINNSPVKVASISF